MVRFRSGDGQMVDKDRKILQALKGGPMRFNKLSRATVLAGATLDRYLVDLGKNGEIHGEKIGSQSWYSLPKDKKKLDETKKEYERSKAKHTKEQKLKEVEEAIIQLKVEGKVDATLSDIATKVGARELAILKKEAFSQAKKYGLRIVKESKVELQKTSEVPASEALTPEDLRNVEDTIKEHVKDILPLGTGMRRQDIVKMLKGPKKSKPTPVKKNY
ncbi:MAG: hypothetical protein V1915_02835 [Candidatus Bathyarchaeota archaeon]